MDTGAYYLVVYAYLMYAINEKIDKLYCQATFLGVASLKNLNSIFPNVRILCERIEQFDLERNTNLHEFL